MRLDQTEMLVAAGRATAQQMRNVLDEIYEELRTSGATRHLSGIDGCNAQIAASIVGIFSLYESRLQSTYGWKEPIKEVQRVLAAAGDGSHVEDFEDLRLAVNVLKHGMGRSHAKLTARADRLPFKVQIAFGDLHEEGDVCPPMDLIVVSPDLLEFCCDAIEKNWSIVNRAATPLSP